MNKECDGGLTDGWWLVGFGWLVFYGRFMVLRFMVRRFTVLQLWLVGYGWLVEGSKMGWVGFKTRDRYEMEKWCLTSSCN